MNATSLPLTNFDYGRASRYDFDNPSKWVTESDVPLLDEHEMSGEDGQPLTFVDRRALQQIADNNNRKVRETGDPATLILGHTSDDPHAPEKPAKGFVVNYRVKPFKRDENGQVRYAIYGDLKVRPRNARLLEEYPRRSVELWWNKKEIDPIAVLGGTTPERDLGVVIRNARFLHIAALGGTVPARSLPQTIRFSRRGNTVIESYTIEPIRRYKSEGKVGKVMSEFKSGELHSGSKSGPKVTSRDQAVAIALSEARKAGGKSAPAKYAEAGEDADYDQYEMTDAERFRERDRQRDKDVADKKKGIESDANKLKEIRDRRKPPPHAKFSQGSPMKPVKKSAASPMGKVTTKHLPTGVKKNGMPPPAKYAMGMGEECPPERYAMDGMDDDDDMPMDDPNNPGIDDTPDSDPTVAKVFQSKEWKAMSQKIDKIFQAVSMAEEAAPPPDDMGGDMGGEGDMPPPGPGGEGAPPPPEEGMGEGGEGDDEMPPDEGNPEEDERRMHGEKPVQFDAMSSGITGPSDSYIPSFEKHKGKRVQPYSRKETVMTRGGGDSRVAKLERELERLRLKLSRADAEKTIQQLKGEGVVFGDTPEESAAGEQDEINFLSELAPEEQAYQVEIYRKRYKRKRANPGNPTTVGVARYARSELSANGVSQNGHAAGLDADGEFVPETTEEASDYADLIAVKKMSRKDAAQKMMRIRRERLS